MIYIQLHGYSEHAYVKLYQVICQRGYMFSLVTMKVNEAAAMHVFLNEREFVSFTYCGQDHRSFIKTSEFEG